MVGNSHDKVHVTIYIILIFVLICIVIQQEPDPAIPFQFQGQLSSKGAKSKKSYNQNLPLPTPPWRTDSYIKNVLLKLEKIRELCGEVCDVTDSHFEKVENVFRKNFNCVNLFRIELLPPIKLPRKAPRKIPSSLLPYYTYNGRAFVQDIYYDQRSKSPVVWTKQRVAKAILDAKNGEFTVSSGGYDPIIAKLVHDEVAKSGNVINKKALVIGSLKPWTEGILLSLNASEVVTMEYSKMRVDFPRLTTMTPRKLYQQYLSDPTNFELFDIIVSFSSLEHSGLGRYGDELNPFGDLIEMARAHCLLKDTGTAIIGVPVREDPAPTILFNAGRIYSHVQLPHFLANWRVINATQQLTGYRHKLFTLQKL